MVDVLISEDYWTREVKQALADLERSVTSLPGELRDSAEGLRAEMKRIVSPMLAVEELEPKLIDDIAARAAAVSHRLVRLFDGKRYFAPASLAPLDTDVPRVPDYIDTVEYIVQAIAKYSSSFAAIAVGAEIEEPDCARFRDRNVIGFVRTELFWHAFHEALATGHHQRAFDFLADALIEGSRASDSLRRFGFFAGDLHRNESEEMYRARMRRRDDALDRCTRPGDLELMLPERFKHLLRT